MTEQNDRPPRAPQIPKIETLILDQHGLQIAFMEGALWPPIGGVTELGPDPQPRDAVVQWVRLRLYETKAQIIVSVVDTENQFVERATSK
jgi:hypothetical protein